MRWNYNILAYATLGCYQGQEGRCGRSWRVGHMAIKFAHAFGAHVIVFTTSPNKKDDPLFRTNDPARAVGQCHVNLGSSTASHTHPLDQILIVTSGCGLVQRWDGPVRKFVPVTWFEFRLVKSIGMVPWRPLP